MQKKIKDSLFITLIICILEVQKQKNNNSPFGCKRLSFMSTKIAKLGITTASSIPTSGTVLSLTEDCGQPVGMSGLKLRPS